MARKKTVKEFAYDLMLGHPFYQGVASRLSLYMSQLAADMQEAAGKLGVDTFQARTTDNWADILKQTTYYAGITNPKAQIEEYGPSNVDAEGLFDFPSFCEALAYAMYRTPGCVVKHSLVSVKQADGSTKYTVNAVYVGTK